MPKPRPTAKIYRYEPRKNTKNNSKTKPVAVKKQHYDFTLFSTILLLSLIGIVMITSSSFYLAYNKFGDSYYFFKRQFLWLVISIGALVFFSNFNYKYLKKFTMLMYLGSNVLLVLVLVIGQRVNGQKRWLFGFQPSEFSKIAIILFMSYYIAKNHKKMRSPKFYLSLLGIVLLPVTLIGIANFSTALVVIVIGFAIIFVAGAKYKHLIMTVLPVAGLGGFFVALPLVTPYLHIDFLTKIADKFLYRLERIQIWFDPWVDPTDLGFQTIQSLYAVGSGGIFGVGLGESIQKRGFIPEAHNDIIFSIICEELGLFGAAIVLLLFLILIWRGIRVALNASDLFGSLIAVGAVTQIAVQVIINVAVNTNTIPVTGMPLPFISAGGSSLLFLMTLMGILLNISRYSKLPN